MLHSSPAVVLQNRISVLSLSNGRLGVLWVAIFSSLLLSGAISEESKQKDRLPKKYTADELLEACGVGSSELGSFFDMTRLAHTNLFIPKDRALHAHADPISFALDTSFCCMAWLRL